MPKHLPLISTLSALTLLLVLPTSGNANDSRNFQALQVAQAGKVAKPEKYRKRKRSRHGRHFMRLYDLNNDGKVTTDEIANDQARILHAIDLNNDKSLSVDEMRRRGRSLQIWRSVTLFDLLDTDGNQKISVGELSAPMKRWFKRYDANGDGVLENNEVKKKRYKRRSKQRGRRYR